MQQPEHILRRQSAAQSAPRRLLGIIVVAGLHLVVIWAVAVSLANGLLQKLPQELKAEVVQQPPPTEKLPPPPPPEMVKPPPPFVPPPDISIQNEAPVTNTITTQSTVASPPPAPKPASAPTPVLSVATNCASSNYPVIAQRLNQQGTTTVLITVGTSGDPTNVKIVDSSGHDSLDNASISCVMSHWHFKPAMENGAPVEGQKEIRIKWQLTGQ